DFEDKQHLLFFTKDGMTKRSELKQYKAQRHLPPLIAIHLRYNDELVNVHQTDGSREDFVASNAGYGAWYHVADISVVGPRAAGVKAIQLKDNEYVVSGQVLHTSDVSLVIVTQRGACKRMTLRDFEKTTRARRGIMMLRELKSKPHRIRGFFVID